MELGLSRSWIEFAGVVVGSPERNGESVNKSVLGAPAAMRCSTDLAGTLRATRPDVAVVATRTRLADVLPQLAKTAAAGVPTVCTAEELAFTRPSDSPDASRIHALASENNVPIVAAGANPGFVLDLIPVILSRAAWDVRTLRARRVVDVSAFGPVVRRSLGIDYDVESFRAGVLNGTIAGHAGFRESLRMIAAAMGRSLDRIEVSTEPRLASRPVTLSDGSVISEDRTIGADQRAIGWIEDKPWTEISMTIHVAPSSEGLRTFDEIEIEGRHPIRLRSEPGFRGVLTTAAVLVNTLPAVVTAAAGVYSSSDLPAIGAWLGTEPPLTNRRR